MTIPDPISIHNLHSAVLRVDKVLRPISRVRDQMELVAVEQGIMTEVNLDHRDGICYIPAFYAFELQALLNEVRDFLNYLISEREKTELEAHPLPWYIKEVEGARWLVDGHLRPIMKLRETEENRKILDFILMKINAV